MASLCGVGPTTTRQNVGRLQSLKYVLDRVQTGKVMINNSRMFDCEKGLFLRHVHTNRFYSIIFLDRI